MFPFAQLREIDFLQLKDSLNEFPLKRTAFYRLRVSRHAADVLSRLKGLPKALILTEKLAIFSLTFG